MLIRAAIARGWQPKDPKYGKIILLGPNACIRSIAEDSKPLPIMSSIVFIIPTHCGRIRMNTKTRIIRNFARRIHEAVDRNLSICMIVAVQGIGSDFDRAKEFAKSIMDELGASPQNCSYLAIALETQGKAATLNAVIRRLPLTVELVGWIDDDVYLEAGCILHIVNTAIDSTALVVGASKRGHPFRTASSSILKRLKLFTRPAMNYPHGCCILVRRSIMPDGIPNRYRSDDGFLCFQAINPLQSDPMHDLLIVRTAICHHRIGAPTASSIVARIRRILINHIVLLSDYPWPVSRYYWRHCLFYGLWPLAPWDRSMDIVRASLKWMLKGIYLLWFGLTAGELLVRGLIRAPLRNYSWSGE